MGHGRPTLNRAVLFACCLAVLVSTPGWAQTQKPLPNVTDFDALPRHERQRLADSARSIIAKIRKPTDSDPWDPPAPQPHTGRRNAWAAGLTATPHRRIVDTPGQHLTGAKEGKSGAPHPQESRPLGLPHSPQTYPVTGDDPGPTPPPLSRLAAPSGWLNTLTATALVVGLVYVLRAVMVRSGKGVVATSHNPAVEVLARVAVAPRSHVLLIRTGRRVLVLGESTAGLCSLADITDDEEIAGLLTAVTAGKSNSISAGFTQLLGRFNRQYDDAPGQIIDARDIQPDSATPDHPAPARALRQPALDVIHDTSGAEGGAGAGGGGLGLDRARDQVSVLLARLKAMRQERGMA